MDGISAGDLARELGTSVPRVTRALERLGIDARLPSGRFAIAPAHAERVRSTLGVTPKVDGLTRSEAMALAALRSAPFGLVSGRAVGRRSGLSPTAATRALKGLLAKDLVTQSREVIAAGRARPAQVWRADFTSDRWVDLDPELAKILPPDRPRPVSSRGPPHLRHLFWNTAKSQLDVDRGGAYIARRLLRTMDLQGLAWGAGALSPEDWNQAARARGLDPKVRRLARNLAEAAA